MRGRAWLVLIALAGCDKVLGLQALPERPEAIGSTLAAGVGHTCAIRSDGALLCWGSNDYGELGLGTDVPEDDAIAPIGDSTWVAIASTSDHTCGIHSDSSLWGCGTTYS